MSGGEPVAQSAFAAAFLAACRERGIRTAIETCGFAQPNAFLSVALVADLVLFDLKLMNSARHQMYTGVANEPILANLESLAQRDGRSRSASRWFRASTILPGPGGFRRLLARIAAGQPWSYCRITASAPRSTGGWVCLQTHRHPAARGRGSCAAFATF